LIKRRLSGLERVLDPPDMVNIFGGVPERMPDHPRAEGRHQRVGDDQRHPEIQDKRGE